MKTATEKTVRGIALSSLAFLGALVLAPSAGAATVFFDDFEDGDHSGWLVTATGVSGSTSVVDHNASLMAYVEHTGTGSHSLSHDFSYVENEPLSFTMQAIATATRVDASSGVTVSFLNTFNISLGSVSLVNATNPASLGPNSFLVDTAQHAYSALLSDWAAQAGLGATDPISKISLSFWSSADSIALTSGWNHSSSEVWFDNVNINAVPVPPAVWLFGSGLLGLVGIARRKKA